MMGVCHGTDHGDNQQSQMDCDKPKERQADGYRIYDAALPEHKQKDSRRTSSCEEARSPVPE